MESALLHAFQLFLAFNNSLKDAFVLKLESAIVKPYGPTICTGDHMISLNLNKDVGLNNTIVFYKSYTV